MLYLLLLSGKGIVGVLLFVSILLASGEFGEEDKDRLRRLVSRRAKKVG
jgi:hypothetical protein